MKKLLLLILMMSLKTFAEESREIKIAFLGDSGATKNFADLLALIKRQKADLVLHAGDLAYDELNIGAPEQWNDYIDAALGESFPYFFVIGNHDIVNWFSPKGYHPILRKRVEKANLNCQPINNNNLYLGIKNHCIFNDLLVVGSGIGTMGVDHNSYIKNTLKENKNIPWKICLWHKNQHDMQTGTKSDEVGWEAYESCQKYGAMILTAHEHAYSRTYTLTDIGNKAEQHGKTGTPENIILERDSTFVAVSGLGGQSIRPYSCLLHQKHTWWASIVTSNYHKLNDQNIFGPMCSGNTNNLQKSGALFITLNYKGNKNQGFAEFITTNNEVLDTFRITRR